MKTPVLVVDDDLVSRELLSEVLTKEGYSVELADSAESAVQVLQKKNIPIVISDIRMIEMSGLDLLKEIKRRWSETVVILMTGFGSVEGAMAAIKEGAFDYISKPFQIGELRSLVRRAIRQFESTRTPEPSRDKAGAWDRDRTAHLMGKSPKIVEVYKICARAALSKSSVLIVGETGTGKAFVARTIHENSSFSHLPLVKLGSELKDDAWITTLSQLKEGSLMIEEIETLSHEKQAALAQFLDVREKERAQFRIFSLSQADLGKLQQGAALKSELFYRLSTITLELPPLRERKEDLSDLIEFYLGKVSQINDRRSPRLTEEASDCLARYGWPGNLRELEQVLERAVALSNSDILEPEDFPAIGKLAVQEVAKAAEPQGVSREAGAPLSSLESMEREHISRVLEECHYNKTKAAETLGIDRATLYRKCKSYGINLKEGKA